MKLAMIVPVLSRFDLFTQMMHSVDVDVRPFVIDNWNGNRGVSPAWNLGIDQAIKAGYTYGLVTNDDVIFSPGVISRMMYNASFLDATFLSAVQHPGGSEVVPGSDFFCFIVNMPRLLAEAGRFDENFTPAYFEDNDMRYRMKLAGSKVYMDTGSYVHHLHSKTQFHDPENPVVPSFVFEMNRLYYTDKWGGLPEQETYTTPYGNPELTIRDWNE